MTNSNRAKSRSRFRRRKGTVGMPPGNLSTDPLAGLTSIRSFAYGPETLREREITRVEDLTEDLNSFPVTWIDVSGLGAIETIAKLGELLHLHPLALEDSVNTHQRAKVDEYGDIVFITSRMISGPPLATEQLSLFIGPNFVVTLQGDLSGDSLGVVRQRIRAAGTQLRQRGPDYLAYELLDAVIDGYFPVLERLSDALDHFDSDESGRNWSPKQFHQLRGEFLELRRSLWPHREMLQSLVRIEHRRIHPETRVYLRDCVDHVFQLIDFVEVSRETLAELRDLHYTQLSFQTNEVMRLLTVLSTFFLPMTFIAGVYGMNFDRMPELHWAWGYPWAWGVMLLTGGLFLWFCWARGILFPDEFRARSEEAAGRQEAQHSEGRRD